MSEQLAQQPITTFDELQEEASQFYMFADPGVFRMLTACIIANQFSSNPVWVILVAGPSGGKSVLLSFFDKVEFPNKQPMIHDISDMTANTLASGMRGADGKETSLLRKTTPGSFLKFKDFTTLLSKQHDERYAILAQLREVFDGAFVKRTGNDNDVSWKGKLGALAACTEVIYEHMEDMASMGHRFMLYRMKQPPRHELVRRVIKNANNEKAQIEYIRMCTKEYIEHILANLKPQAIALSEDVTDRFIALADFCSEARSGVTINSYKERIEFVPEKELPGRIVGQFFAIAQGFIAIRQVEHLDRFGTLDNFDAGVMLESEMKCIEQMALDSIPIQRRMVMKELARYRGGAYTAAIATKLQYQSDVVKLWLYQLNGLGICQRSKENRAGMGDLWLLDEQYRDIICKYEEIEPQEGSLDHMSGASFKDREKAMEQHVDELNKDAAAMSGQTDWSTSQQEAEEQWENLFAE